MSYPSILYTHQTLSSRLFRGEPFLGEAGVRPHYACAGPIASTDRASMTKQPTA